MIRNHDPFRFNFAWYHQTRLDIPRNVIPMQPRLAQRARRKLCVNGMARMVS
jgi:hypothetical protein